MKVLHVGYSDTRGGAAIAMMRLHQSLIDINCLFESMKRVASDPFAAGLGGGPFAAAPAPAPAAVAPVGAAPSDDPFAAAFSESCSCGSADPFGAAPFSGAAAPVAPSAGGGALDPALFGGAPPANPFG